uniref:Uncharacterized protein n=1 Tax=Rhizophora mucronata TaxID=61149 RepID=A0A2P2MY97_RHIMU
MHRMSHIFSIFPQWIIIDCVLWLKIKRPTRCNPPQFNIVMYYINTEQPIKAWLGDRHR